MIDSYDWFARIAPAQPIVLAVWAVAGIFGVSIGVVTGLLAVTSSVAPFVVSWVREKGRAAEPVVWPAGLPAASKLRSNGATRKRVALMLSVSADSLQDPQRAAEAISELRSLTRNRSEYPTVFRENCSYGFERNLYGLKRSGLVLTSCCLLIAIVAWALPLQLDEGLRISPLTSIIAELGLLLFWAFRPSRAKARVAGNRYVDELLSVTNSELFSSRSRQRGELP